MSVARDKGVWGGGGLGGAPSPLKDGLGVGAP